MERWPLQPPRRVCLGGLPCDVCEIRISEASNRMAYEPRWAVILVPLLLNEGDGCENLS
ncbi:MAG TPA: hypothetical protein VHR72_13100 [Gemmataceae bacterium]|jgi:hypothetical protein|nr:hypothetical protein [Gemmataceae bacterium]